MSIELRADKKIKQSIDPPKTVIRLWVRSFVFLFLGVFTMSDSDVTLYAKITESFCEATGMTPEVFHATVIGNIEQAYREHISEMIAKHGWDPARVAGTFCETATKGMIEMVLEHEATALFTFVDGLPVSCDGHADDPVDAMAWIGPNPGETFGERWV